jgi:hypothetical protein
MSVAQPSLIFLLLEPRKACWQPPFLRRKQRNASCTVHRFTQPLLCPLTAAAVWASQSSRNETVSLVSTFHGKYPPCGGNPNTVIFHSNQRSSPGGGGWGQAPFDASEPPDRRRAGQCTDQRCFFFPSTLQPRPSQRQGCLRRRLRPSRTRLTKRAASW